MSHRGAEAVHGDSWARAYRREGYADGKQGVEPRAVNGYYQRGYREGTAARQRLEDRLLVESSPPMDFIDGPDFSVDERAFAEFIREVGRRAVEAHVEDEYQRDAAFPGAQWTPPT